MMTGVEREGRDDEGEGTDSHGDELGPWRRGWPLGDASLPWTAAKRVRASISPSRPLPLPGLCLPLFSPHHHSTHPPTAARLRDTSHSHPSTGRAGARSSVRGRQPSRPPSAPSPAYTPSHAVHHVRLVHYVSSPHGQTITPLPHPRPLPLPAPPLRTHRQPTPSPFQHIPLTCLDFRQLPHRPQA